MSHVHFPVSGHVIIPIRTALYKPKKSWMYSTYRSWICTCKKRKKKESHYTQCMLRSGLIELVQPATSLLYIHEKDAPDPPPPMRSSYSFAAIYRTWYIPPKDGEHHRQRCFRRMSSQANERSKWNDDVVDSSKDGRHPLSEWIYIDIVYRLYTPFHPVSFALQLRSMCKG